MMSKINRILFFSFWALLDHQHRRRRCVVAFVVIRLMWKNNFCFLSTGKITIQLSSARLDRENLFVGPFFMGFKFFLFFFFGCGCRSQNDWKKFLLLKFSWRIFFFVLNMSLLDPISSPFLLLFDFFLLFEN